MIYILHLESSTKSCSVALSKDGELVACKEVLSADFSHSENLTVFVEDVIKEAGISLKQLAAISVASGPGSYTGLRIGVSTAKGFCYALDIPLISIDSLSSIAYLAKEKHENETILAMFDARRREVYSAIFSKGLQVVKEISADILDDNTYKEFEPFVAVGDGVPKMLEEWNGRNFQFDESIFASARGQIQLVYEKFKQQQFENVAYFEPFYLKDFMITQSKK
ncbi:MAG: tRNA (adenosine(37)-N6)-threonylcarbamoyltransferase complex dimerization subunit type 1 TsaB [Bacteroidota bacterium]